MDENKTKTLLDEYLVIVLLDKDNKDNNGICK